MNWAEVATKNARDQVKKKKVYEKEKIKKPVDLYPEDLFDMIYLEEIRTLNTEINEEIYATGSEILNYNYNLHDLYEFIVYHTNLDSFQEELLNEETNEETNGDKEKNYYDNRNKNIILHKDEN